MKNKGFILPLCIPSLALVPSSLCHFFFFSGVSSSESPAVNVTSFDTSHSSQVYYSAYLCSFFFVLQFEMYLLTYLQVYVLVY